MFHELRTYRLNSFRLMDGMHGRMRDHMVPLFHEHEMRPVGSWDLVFGKEMPTFFYMLEWESMEERQRKFDEFYRDPRINEMRDSTIDAAGGTEFVRDADVQLLRHADYLPFGGRERA